MVYTSCCWTGLNMASSSAGASCCFLQIHGLPGRDALLALALRIPAGRRTVRGHHRARSRRSMVAFIRLWSAGTHHPDPGLDADAYSKHVHGALPQQRAGLGSRQQIHALQRYCFHPEEKLWLEIFLVHCAVHNNGSCQRQTVKSCSTLLIRNFSNICWILPRSRRCLLTASATNSRIIPPIHCSPTTGPAILFSGRGKVDAVVDANTGKEHFTPREVCLFLISLVRWIFSRLSP